MVSVLDKLHDRSSIGHSRHFNGVKLAVLPILGQALVACTPLLWRLNVLLLLRRCLWGNMLLLLPVVVLLMLLVSWGWWSRPTSITSLPTA